MLKVRTRSPEIEEEVAPPARKPDTGHDFAWAWTQMSAGKVVRIQNEPDITFCIAEVKAARIRMLIATYPNSDYADDYEPGDEVPLNDIQTHHMRDMDTGRLFSKDWELVP